MSDERLARWAAKGSQPAFAVIFERHHQALHRYCQSIIGNGHDAADALQNTMLKAMRALPGETRTIALKPWLYGSLTTSRSRCCARAAADSDLDAAAHVGDPGAETIVESRERLRDLTADLGELTEQQRGTLLMRELAGLEFDEISAALQLSATAAKQSVYEARCALQALEEGRAMDCDVIRRTLSDGDRRTLRNLKMRGHLRACAGCRDFEAALRQRPAHLAALTPALPARRGGLDPAGPARRRHRSRPRRRRTAGRSRRRRQEHRRHVAGHHGRDRRGHRRQRRRRRAVHRTRRTGAAR